jgi:hypothetical protein
MILGKDTLPELVYLNNVRIASGLWGERQTVNRNRTIPAIHAQLEKTGRIDAWRLDPNREHPPSRSAPYLFWDSDSGKWLEAVGYSLQTHPDPALEKQADELISLIASA